MVRIWDTFATESCSRLVECAGRRRLPGASPHLRFVVNGMQTTVAIRLRLIASPCTMTTGRRKPGPDPVGGGSSAHHTSPWETTT